MPSPLPQALADDVAMGAAVWHADALARPAGRVAATGFAALDAQLPGGGWPVGAMVELLQNPGEHLEWRLLLPALAGLARQAADTGAVVLVGAPHVPFGPALAAQGLDPDQLLWISTDVPLQRLWAAEQALRCAGVSAVLAWLPQARADQLRRLQMAAAEHALLLFVMRPAQAQAHSSPAVLRLSVTARGPDAAMGPGEGTGGDALQLHLIKRRGPPLDRPLVIPAGPARLAALLAVRQGLAPQVTVPTSPRPTTTPVVISLAMSPQEKGDALDRTAIAA